MRLRPGQLQKLQQQQVESTSKEGGFQELATTNIKDLLLNKENEKELSGKAKQKIISPCKLPTIELSFFERQKMADLGHLISASLGEEACCPEVVGETTGIYYLSNLSAVYGRRQCQLVKRIPLFNWLKADLQLELFRHFCFNFMVVRASFQLNRKTGLFRLFMNETGSQTVDVRIDTSFTTRPELIHENIAIISELNSKMEGDQTVRNLLSAILLFKQPKFALCEPVRYQYHQYCRLLRRYLQSKYAHVGNNKIGGGGGGGEEFAFQRYCSLMRTIHEDLDRVKENMRFLLYEVGVHRVADIVAEVMNLEEDSPFSSSPNSSSNSTSGVEFISQSTSFDFSAW